MTQTIQYNPDVLSCLANLSNDEVFTPPAFQYLCISRITVNEV
ncbi:MAG TPA: hypothetical protein PLM81_04160 [Ginsengibacter sp.]|nr:hypothetical protein [Ginsengibacter sp.]HRP16414.1 hypothetical protein [Ginsengibacter sp.]HRP43221.1 hypothetical protein [Ginsengibacter sp.]